ncbi:hypothetical protein ACEQ8H_004564 [Pleosporales sp. CAS-2024a]
MSGWSAFLIFLAVVVVLLIVSYLGWYLYARWNASRHGLPTPSMNPIAAFKQRSAGAASSSNYPGPAPTGIKGFIDAQLRKFKNRNNRTAAGAYEEPAYARGRGAGSRLDPDEAWSARVGDEAYYEEQELGLQEPSSTRANPYANTAYMGPHPGIDDSARGRSRQRDSYDDRSNARTAPANPFGDDNAASLRGVSPRPLANEDTSYHGPTTQVQKLQRHHSNASVETLESPTGSRRSVFKEDIR